MNKKSPLFKVSLLSISLILAAASIISPLIPIMADSFPGLDKSSIELITTMPNFGILLFVLVSPAVVRVIGKRKTVLLGLTIALVAGLVPVFTENYLAILISRFAFGAGTGLYNSLAVSLITENYEGSEQATMVGWESAMGSIGATVLTLLVGRLSSFGWHTSFLAYGITVLPLVLFALFVKIPEDQDGKTRKAQVTPEGQKQRLTMPVVVMTVLAVLVFASFYTVMIKTSSLLVDENLGTAGDAGNILGFITFIGILLDIVYGKIVEHMEKIILPVGLIGMGLSFVLVFMAKSLSAVAVGVLASGFFYCLAAPYMFMLVSRISPKSSVNLSTGVYLFGINLGIFLSPYFNVLLESVIGSYSAAYAFLANGILMAVVGIAVIPLLAGLNKKFPPTIESAKADAEVSAAE